MQRIEQVSKHDIFDLSFDEQLQRESNTLISGTNATGKSRLACALASGLMHLV